MLFFFYNFIKILASTTNTIWIKTPHLDHLPVHTPKILFFNLVRHIPYCYDHPSKQHRMLRDVGGVEMKTGDCASGKENFTLQPEPCTTCSKIYLISSSCRIFKYAPLPDVNIVSETLIAGPICSVASQTRPSYCAHWQRRIVAHNM